MCVELAPLAVLQLASRPGLASGVAPVDSVPAAQGASSSGAAQGAGSAQSPSKRALMPTTAFKQNARLGRGGAGHRGAAADAASSAAQARAFDKNIQQLRGIFAGFDENRDNSLQRGELVNALLSLGIRPTDSLLKEYFDASPHSDKVDLATFLDVSMRCLGGAATIFSEVMEVMREADGDKTGRLAVPSLRHLLQHVETGTQLTSEETEDFLKMIGISDLLGQAQRSHAVKVANGTARPGARAPSESDFEVNYAALIDDMLFVDREAAGGGRKGRGRKASTLAPPRL